MKKILGIIIYIIFILTGGSEKEPGLGEKSKYDINNELVSLEVKDNSLINGKITLVITNYTDNECTFGNSYVIEKEEEIFGIL